MQDKVAVSEVSIVHLFEKSALLVHFVLPRTITLKLTPRTRSAVLPGGGSLTNIRPALCMSFV